MIRTRRRIETEQDRYGGYGYGGRTVRSESDDVLSDNLSFDRLYPPEPEARSFVDPYSAPSAPYPMCENRASNAGYLIETEEKETGVNYSTRADADYMIRPYRSEAYIPAAPARRKKTAVRRTEDVMPRISNEKREREQSEAAARRRKEQSVIKSAGRSKVILGVYIAVVLILAAIVIGTGVAITGASSRVSALESRYAALNSEIADQKYDLKMLEDDTFLTGRATESGMGKIGDNAVAIETIDIKDETVYEKRTNWFDRFCDWLSNII